MLSTKTIEIFEKNGGILSTQDAEKYNLTRETLRQAYHRGDIVRAERGIYLLSDEYYDQMLITQKVLKRGVFSHETAVFLYNYSTFIPHRYHMTFPHGYHSNNFEKLMVKPTFATPKFYGLGISEAENWDCNLVTTYNRERTVLDILRSDTAMASVREETIENYLYDPDKNLDRLIEYAQLMKMEDEVKNEVLKYT